MSVDTSKAGPLKAGPLKTGPPLEEAANPSAGIGLGRVWPVGLLLCALAVFFLLGLDRYATVRAVVEHRAVLTTFVSDHFALAVVAFVATYIALVSLSFPGASLMTVVGGFLFGTALGSVLTVLAATAGATLLFLVARSWLGRSLARRAGPLVSRFAQRVRDNAFYVLLTLRLAPLFPFWLVNLAPALIGVRLRDHVLSTAIGIIPGTIAFSAIGAGLDSVVARQEAATRACLSRHGNDCRDALDLQALASPQLLLALGALAVVAAIPVAIKAARARPS
jgi:uncharacterized membrane protein YdjX (TVP38/TMEM64 family)